MPVRQRSAAGALLQWLGARSAEIERAILDRAYAVSNPAQVGDPVYVAGIGSAVSAAVDYALAGLARGEARPAPVPTVLLGQAREAARRRVAIDTVLRRYFAGHILLDEFLHQAAEDTGLLEDPAFARLRRDLYALADRLVSEVAEEYRREQGSLAGSSADRRVELVRRILAGDFLDAAELGYSLEAWHLAVVGIGQSVDAALRDLAAASGKRLLLVDAGQGVRWGWLGSATRIDVADVGAMVAALAEGDARLAIGEIGNDIDGWRLSHRQAAAALPVAIRGRRPLVRYADVALLAAALGDQLLAASLHAIYLAPFASRRDGGPVLLRTARAYFAAQRNAASAAAALGITRQTVNNHLRAIEDRLERALPDCAAEFEVAVRLDDFDRGELAEKGSGLTGA
jgi:PucR C-terminal helix-turn-helix domain/GGDEF-like domain